MVGPAPPAHAAGYAVPPAAWPGQLISTATVICENNHFQGIRIEASAVRTALAAAWLPAFGSTGHARAATL